MTVTPSSTIVGVFRDRATAEQALDALYYSGTETSGGFFDDLKNFFTGQNTSGDVAHDLTDLGLSNDDANYYASEHSKGNVILAIKAPGRGAEAQTILQQYGSLNAQPSYSSQDIAYSSETQPQASYSSQATTYNSDTATPFLTNGNSTAQTTSPTTHYTDTTYSSSSQNAPSEYETSPLATQPVTTHDNDDMQHVESSVTTHDNIVQQEEPSITTHDDTQHTTSFTSDTPPITQDNVMEATHMEPTHTSEEAQPVVTDGSLPQNTISTTSSEDTNTAPSYTTETGQHPDTDLHLQTFAQDAQPITTGGITSDTYTTGNATTDTQTTSDAQPIPVSTSSDTQPVVEDTAPNTFATTNIQSTSDAHATTDPHATSDAMIESETPLHTTGNESPAIVESYTEESEAAGIPDIQTAQPVATTSDYSSEPELISAQEVASNAPTEPLTTNSTTSDDTPLPSTTTQQPVTGTTTTSSDANDELQSLQAQIASLQQQLQDKKAQLQAAKDREEQVRTARERAQQLQSLREQLQALQAELAATHSELQETQSRIQQY